MAKTATIRNCSAFFVKHTIFGVY